MATIDVYEQYFEADLCYNGVQRHGAKVMLTADSEAGNIKYTAAVSFFPHRDEEDYAVSYDAYFEKVLFEGNGRRSKKRDESFLKILRSEIDSLSKDASGKVNWDRPLREARYA